VSFSAFSSPTTSVTIMSDTPASQGYRLPAEWETHEATWIAWPHNRDDWPGKFGPIPWVYAEIVKHVSRVETVRILIQNREARDDATERLWKAGAEMSRVEFVKVQTDRVWTRDYAPSFIVRESEGPAPVATVDWGFNAWAKYDNHAFDNKIGRCIAKRHDLPRWKPTRKTRKGESRVFLEGGAIDVNGLGTLLTTEECLLSEIQARNPGLSREELEQYFHDFLGVRHVIWLGRGIIGDDTHGHVDDLARFVGPKTVVTVIENDPTDLNFEPLKENLERLRVAKDQDGKSLKIVTLPMPEPIVFDGQRLPASYANFYIANGLVLVPTFNDPHDAEALSTLGKLFKARRVVGIHAVDLVWGFGTVHCMTHEQPAAPVRIMAESTEKSASADEPVAV
jgi:agmatine deiminase